MSTNAEFDSLVPASSFDRRSFLVTSLGPVLPSLCSR